MKPIVPGASANVPILGKKRETEKMLADAKPFSKAECDEIAQMAQGMANHATANGQPLEAMAVPMLAAAILRMDAYFRESRKLLEELTAINEIKADPNQRPFDAMVLKESKLKVLAEKAQKFLDAPPPALQINTNPNLNALHAAAMKGDLKR